ncbi:MAG: glycosyltransferase [Bacteroidetes bacterium HGW-Bacteroidetes-6]|jgi:glycosyltransferase involved in cell wall biosynthesis|nr:MAG: glycosyltransferase [Bacteroidetes bacterium HGW-Bacteroidetes-6]
MDISVVIPLLNEEESLPELAAWIDRVMLENQFSFEIIFVDDGSTDHSWEIINKLCSSNSNIKGIRFSRNYGKSAALQAAFERIQGDVVITMDADLQDSPDEIPGLYKMVTDGQFDLVSGWKKKRFDNRFTKNIPSKLYNWTTRKLSGVKLHDMNCGLKAYRNEVIQHIEVYGEMHRYLPVIAKWAGFSKIGEKVVQHRKRQYGTSKFGMSRFIRGPLDLITIMFVGKFSKRPMHFFGSMGGILFLIGFAIAGYLAWEKIFDNMHRMTELPIFYLALLCMIIGSQLFIGGFLAEMIGRATPDRNKYIIKEELNSNHEE